MKPVEKHSLKKDDAVANVVVMMLILSVVVIAFAVIVTVYLPSLKETAELQHSEDVKEAFLQFASDVDAVYTRGQTGSYSQEFSLGGGDIQFSTSRSAGTVNLGSEYLDASSPETVEFRYYNSTLIYLNKTRGALDPTGGTKEIRLNTVALAYTPVMSFWEDQGYNYSKGVVWVNKNGEYTPVSSLLYNRVDGINEQDSTVSRWIHSFNPVLVDSNMTILRDEGTAHNITGIDNYYVYVLTLVNFTADPKQSYLSGNGNAELRISAEWESETEYTLDPSYPLKIGGESVALQTGTQPTRLRVTMINAKVSLS